MSFRMFSMISACLLSVPVVAIVGCGSSTDTSAPPTGSLYKYETESSFCAALAAAECGTNVVEGCYGSDATKLDANTETCVAVRDTVTNCRMIPGYESADMSGVRYNPETADACVESRRAIYADATVTRAELDMNGEVCLAVFSKEQKSGSACTSNIDCDTTAGLRCVVKGGAGTCTAPVIVGGGIDCSDEDAVCADGFYCDTAGSGSCIQRKSVGKACDESILCEESLDCVIVGADGVCNAKASDGVECTADELCAGSFCEKPAGGSDGTCTSTLELHKTSASCDPFKP